MNYNFLGIVNFIQLNALNKVTLDLDTSILFGAISYQVKHTRIKREGKEVIARTREQLAAYIGCSLSTVDRKIAELKELRLIDVNVGLWRGVKRLFISCQQSVNFSVNIKRLLFINNYTHNTKATLTLSYLAYKIDTSKDWSKVSKKDLCELLGLTLRGCNAIIDRLQTIGVIKTRREYGFGRDFFIIKIQDEKYQEMRSAWSAFIDGLNLSKVSKMTISNNNRYTRDLNIKDNNIYTKNPQQTDKSDINSENEEIKLTNHEVAYARRALENTVLKAKSGLTLTLNALWQQVRFSLTNFSQRKGTQSFKHAVNRIMALIRNGSWKTPFGYGKYSIECKEQYVSLKKNEKAHYAQKSGVELARLAEAKELPSEFQYSRPEGLKFPSAERSKEKSTADIVKQLFGGAYGLAT